MEREWFVDHVKESTQVLQNKGINAAFLRANENGNSKETISVLFIDRGENPIPVNFYFTTTETEEKRVGIWAEIARYRRDDITSEVLTEIAQWWKLKTCTTPLQVYHLKLSEKGDFILGVSGPAEKCTADTLVRTIDNFSKVIPEIREELRRLLGDDSLLTHPLTKDFGNDN